MDQQPDFHVDWNILSQDTNAQQDFLRRELALVDSKLDQIGPLGSIIKREFKRAALQYQKIDPAKEDWGAIYEPLDNGVTYGKHSFGNREAFCDLSIHERIHSTQFLRAAVLLCDAAPVNGRMHMLSPRSTIAVATALEGDCQSKLRYILYCMDGTCTAPETPEELEKFRPTLEKWLAKTARNIMQNGRDKDEYDAFFISEFKKGSGKIKSRYDLPIDIVQHSARDIIRIGSSLGLHTFGRSERKAAEWGVLKLSPENEASLRELEQEFNCVNNEGVKYFGDVLKDVGITERQFIRQGRAAIKAHALKT